MPDGDVPIHPRGVRGHHQGHLLRPWPLRPRGKRNPSRGLGGTKVLAFRTLFTGSRIGLESRCIDSVSSISLFLHASSSSCTFYFVGDLTVKVSQRDIFLISQTTVWGNPAPPGMATSVVAQRTADSLPVRAEGTGLLTGPDVDVREGSVQSFITHTQAFFSFSSFSPSPSSIKAIVTSMIPAKKSTALVPFKEGCPDNFPRYARDVSVFAFFVVTLKMCS